MEHKELQEKYYLYQNLHQQIKQESDQLQELNNKLVELEYIKMSLDELKSVEAGSEILAPISSGIFIKAELKKNDELLVNVGGNTVVGKDVEETKALMDTQVREIEEYRDKQLQKLQGLVTRARELEKELSEMAG